MSGWVVHFANIYWYASIVPLGRLASPYDDQENSRGLLPITETVMKMTDI